MATHPMGPTPSEAGPPPSAVCKWKKMIGSLVEQRDIWQRRRRQIASRLSHKTIEEALEPLATFWRLRQHPQEIPARSLEAFLVDHQFPMPAKLPLVVEVKVMSYIATPHIRIHDLTYSIDTINEAIDALNDIGVWLSRTGNGDVIFDVKEAKATFRKYTSTEQLAARAVADSQKVVRKSLDRILQLGGIDDNTRGILKRADRSLCDIVVWRCHAMCDNPRDRDRFLGLAEVAYNGDFGKQIRSRLLLKYHKDASNLQSGFHSMNAAQDRRPRRLFAV